MMRKEFLIFIFCCIISIETQAQLTSKIWIVRHAEKQSNDPKNPNPLLTIEGEKRAADLSKYLKNEKIDYIFSTDYLRTKQTALPTAKQKKLETIIYNDKSSEDLIQKIKNIPIGKNSLIIGHSNTVLPILEMLGATINVKTLKDNDYDFIFELTVRGNNIKMKTRHYGKQHHSTEIK